MSMWVYTGLCGCLCGSMWVSTRVYTGLCRSLLVLGYHWLPLATIDLVDDKREFELRGIF